MTQFSDLVGMTLTKISEDYDGGLVMVTDTGRRFRQYHNQDCCESVNIEEIIGDLGDLIGSPILLAEELSSDTPEGPVADNHYADECEEWTFYELATNKGSVTIRWYGTSNGYYSTSVSFEEIAA